MLDLAGQYEQVKDDVRAAIDRVLESQQFILGPEVERFEQAVAVYSGGVQAVGVSSGSDAVLLSLMAEDVGPGDEVITTPYTFFATVGAISRLGATPVFVDICRDSYNLDVSQLEKRISSRTKAIIPVHLFGQCADMDPILELARQHNLIVIEDAAQAIGAEYQDRRSGSMGDYGCFSFFPSKNLGAPGDGGMVVTRCEERAERLRILRNHGARPKYHHRVIGGNFRLDALHAAVLCAKLPYLDGWTAARQRNADHYRTLFLQSSVLDRHYVELPTVLAHRRHIYNQYVIRTPHRDALQDSLRSAGIATAVYYPVPMHLQACFKHLGYCEGDLPHSEAAARETLALPIFPELTQRQIEYVVARIAACAEVRSTTHSAAA